MSQQGGITVSPQIMAVLGVLKPNRSRILKSGYLLLPDILSCGILTGLSKR